MLAQHALERAALHAARLAHPCHSSSSSGARSSSSGARPDDLELDPALGTADDLALVHVELVDLDVRFALRADGHRPQVLRSDHNPPGRRGTCKARALPDGSASPVRRARRRLQDTLVPAARVEQLQGLALARRAAPAADGAPCRTRASRPGSGRPARARACGRSGRPRASVSPCATVGVERVDAVALALAPGAGDAPRGQEARRARSRLKPPVSRRTRPSASSTRISRSSRTNTTALPSGARRRAVSSPALGCVSGLRATRAVWRGLEQVQPGGLAGAAPRRDHEPAAVRQPGRLRVLPVDAERQDAHLAVATATTARRPFIANATRVPSGETAGSAAGSLPKRQPARAVPRQPAPVESRRCRRGRSRTRSRPRGPGAGAGRSAATRRGRRSRARAPRRAARGPSSPYPQSPAAAAAAAAGGRRCSSRRALATSASASARCPRRV